MQDILLISSDRLFSRMLTAELKASLRRNTVCAPTLTYAHLEELLARDACGLLILDLDVHYIHLERILNLTVEHKIPVILFGYPDSGEMTAEKMRFYDSDIYRYVFPRPFLMSQFLYCARELTHTKEEEPQEQREAPAMKMKQHCAAYDIRINEEAHTVHYRNDLIPLTKTEYDVLNCLMRQRGSVISRAELSDTVHGSPEDGRIRGKGSNVIDVYIRFLRQKLDEPYRVKLIETVRGVGYIIRKE